MVSTVNTVSKDVENRPLDQPRLKKGGGGVIQSDYAIGAEEDILLLL